MVFWPPGLWEFSSPIRDQTHTPCIGRQSLNCGTAREVLIAVLLTEVHALFVSSQFFPNVLFLPQEPHLTFYPYVSLGSSGPKETFSNLLITLTLITLVVLRNTSQVFRRRLHILRPVFFSWLVKLGLWVLWRKTTEVMCHSLISHQYYQHD